MLSFFISLYRLVKIIVLGIKNDPDFRFLFFFILMLLVSATIFYSKIEEWSILDSFYFSAMTMSTVGYGDLAPATNIGKLFTIIFTFLSIGSFVSFTAKTVQIILMNNKNRKAKIAQKILAKNKNHNS